VRAALQRGVRTIEVVDLPPPRPTGDEALVAVRAAGICGSDLHPYHGRSEPQALPEGHEVAGDVLELPPGYQGPARVGDLVAVETICLGTACGGCEMCLAGQPFHCPARRTAPARGGGFGEQLVRRAAGLFPLPPGLTAEQGALVEPLAVGVHALRWARMRPDATVAIVGAGTIGLMSLIAARALGAGPTYVLARHDHQAATAEALGATRVLRGEGDEAVAELRELTDGRGADLVVETVGGHASTVDLCWELARIQGTVAVVGIFGQPVPVNLLRPVVRELWATFPICYGVVDGRHDFDVAIELIAAGRAPVERLVSHRFPFDGAAAAFRAAADKSTGSLKVQLVSD
jgi:threonine dehydrogenase-like Zn-dependent dehydrogenase